MIFQSPWPLQQSVKVFLIEIKILTNIGKKYSVKNKCSQIFGTADRNYLYLTT